MEQTNNSREILNSLIEKKKSGKDPNQSDSSMFLKAWLSLALQEGYTEELERYLYDGFIYSGIYPFKEYFVKADADTRDKLLSELFNGKMYGQNTDITFKVLIHLSAACINDERISRKHERELLMRLPKFASNKEGKPLGTAPRNVIKYFFGVINPNVDFDLSELQLDANTEIQIKYILHNAVEFGRGQQLTSKEAAGLATAIEWFDLNPKAPAALGDADNSNSMETAPDTNAGGKSDKPSATPPNKAPEQVTNKGDAVNNPDNYAPAGTNPLLRQISQQISQQLDQLVTINKVQQDRFDLQLSSLREQVRELMAENSSLKDTNMKYLQERLNLERTVDQLQAEVADKDVIIAEMREMQSVISRDEENKSGEAMKRLAAKLQLDYQDFCDAQDAPMTVGLGENMRLQLQSVFDILINSGIELE